VKELRLAGISTIEAANAFLPSFVANYNGRFAKPAARDQDFHRSVDPRQDLDQILCWREQRQVSNQLVVNYSRMKLTLKPEGLAVRLRGKMVEIYDFPDGRTGGSLERQVVALLGLRQAAARQSCRHCREQALGRDPGLDQGTARPPAPFQPSSGWTATIEPAAGHSKEPCRANHLSRQIPSKSLPPRPAPLRYGGLRGAGSHSQRSRRLTF